MVRILYPTIEFLHPAVALFFSAQRDLFGLKDVGTSGEDVALEFSGVDMSIEVMAWYSMT